ncbi:MAG TPA: ABC transporter substrate-binding protein [Kofleriaceae bacterium]|nr:ABC transporter substrate-binding protein [Kofleriaceae bacterium]
MSRRACLAVASLALVLGGACDPPADGPRFRAAGATTPRDGGTLRFSIIAGVSSLDPTLASDELSYYVVHALFDTLVDFGPPGPHAFELVPRLAERWSISSDGRTYHFWLRPGAVYADGAPITAAHVKYSLERAMVTPGSLFGQYLADIVGARAILDQAARDAADQKPAPVEVPSCPGIVARDDHELTIELTQDNPAFLAILAMPFATPQRADHVRAAGDQLRRQPDASGPFVLARWDEGNIMVLTRNPRYYDPHRAHLDALELHENVARDSAFLLFERGELDTAEKLAAPDLIYVMREPAWQPSIHRLAGLNVFGSRMNVTQGAFRNRRVRQALNYALDKTHTARLLHGTSEPAHGVLPPGMLGRDPALMPYPHDVGRARSLLAEAGYSDDHPLRVDYVFPDDDETAMVAGSLQSDLAAAGVRVTLVPMAFETWQAAVGQRNGPAFSYTGWTADFADPMAFFEPCFHSRSITEQNANNNAFYANPALDEVLDAAHVERDPAARDALYRRAERIVYDDAPWIWDYHRVIIEVSQPYVRGYDLHPIWVRDFTSAWLDLGPDGRPLRAEGR